MLFSFISIPNGPKHVALSCAMGNPLRAEPVPRMISLYVCEGRKECLLQAYRVLYGHDSRESLYGELFHYPCFRIRKLRSREVK